MKVTYLCEGCSEHFCFEHLSQHRTEIAQEFDQLQNDHNQVRQKIDDFKIHPANHPLIKRIDRWEKVSINKIKQEAQRCRTQLIHHSNTFLLGMEKKLNDLAQHIKDIHREDTYNEIDLNDLKQRLDKLAKELNKPTNFSIKQQSTSFINSISLMLPFENGKKQLSSF